MAYNEWVKGNVMIGSRHSNILRLPPPPEATQLLGEGVGNSLIMGLAPLILTRLHRATGLSARVAKLGITSS